MELDEAKAIIRPDEPLCTADIRRRYRKRALECHPDKGGSSAEFQRLTEAHDILQSAAGSPGEKAETRYDQLLQEFLRAAFGEGGVTGKGIIQALENVANGCRRAARCVSLLGAGDPDTCSQVLDFVERHADTLHVSKDGVRRVRQAFNSQDKPHYVLQPCLEHILEAHVFPLSHNGRVHMVPLWHDSMVFDTSNGDVRVKCCATLPDHIQIDENDDVHVDIRARCSDILAKDKLEVPMGSGALEIPARSLALARRQVRQMKGRAGPRINPKAAYDDSVRGDVFVHITLA